MEVLESARSILIEKGWDPKFGGRPLRRTIQKELEERIANLMIRECWSPGTTIIAEGRCGEISIAAYPDAGKEFIAEEELIENSK
jgi:ATP-dependent Clp protease ATP-binding subunit ClpC